MSMVSFKNLEKGVEFELNGNRYIKLSTRTAKPLFDCHISYFYIGLNEQVKH